MPDYTLLEGDCLESLKTLADNSVDAVVTDPPYHLTEIKTSRQSFGSQLNGGRTKEQKAARAGFMGKSWDGGDIAFRPALWSEVLRVLKPGGHLASFGGTRTFHRMACAIEDAGFEIRDQIQWIYSQGFPKSRSMREIGRPELGTALKPANEPICLARKPLSEKTVAANVLRWGTGAINVDATRIGVDGGTKTSPGDRYNTTIHAFGDGLGAQGGKIERVEGLGRFPANLCHDGSDEVLDLFPETKSGSLKPYKGTGIAGNLSSGMTDCLIEREGDSGSAARFFYCAKASKHDRAGSRHPTVKPINLMRWLARLITPPSGVILDPFAGSGTTGIAARLEGFRSILCEREAEYIADIRNRMDERVSQLVAAE